MHIFLHSLGLVTCAGKYGYLCRMHKLDRGRRGGRHGARAGEEQARAEYEDIAVYVSDFKPMLQTLGGGNDRITMKLVVDTQTDAVVGCHMVGEHAAEIIQGMGIALKAGATKAHFDATVGIHPSAAEEFVTMREKAR